MSVSEKFCSVSGVGCQLFVLILLIGTVLWSSFWLGLGACHFMALADSSSYFSSFTKIDNATVKSIVVNQSPPLFVVSLTHPFYIHTTVDLNDRQCEIIDYRSFSTATKANLIASNRAHTESVSVRYESMFPHYCYDEANSYYLFSHMMLFFVLLFIMGFCLERLASRTKAALINFKTALIELRGEFNGYNTIRETADPDPDNEDRYQYQEMASYNT